MCIFGYTPLDSRCLEQDAIRIQRTIHAPNPQYLAPLTLMMFYNIICQLFLISLHYKQYIQTDHYACH